MSNIALHEMTPREVCAQDIPHTDKMRVVILALWDKDPWLCFDFARWCSNESLQHVDSNWRARISAVIEDALNPNVLTVGTAARAIVRNAFSVGADVAAWSARTAEELIESAASTGRTHATNAAILVANIATRCASEKAAIDAKDHVMGPVGEEARKTLEKQQIEHALEMLESTTSQNTA